MTDIHASVEGLAPTAADGPGTLLPGAARLWFATASLGLVTFVGFIGAFYGVSTLRGDLAAWNDKPHINAFVPGDPAGNAAFAFHVLLGGLMTASGLLQLIPRARRKAPALHRWNGRGFLALGTLVAVSGLGLVWVRGSYLSLVSGVSVSLNGVLILTFALLTWRTAAARRFDAHRRWAMRLFMVANGVWFFRVLLMAWVIVNQGPRGMTATLDGPADIALQFASYLLPLLALELWFHTTARPTPWRRRVVALALVAATALMGVGIFGTVALMWLPHL